MLPATGSPPSTPPALVTRTGIVVLDGRDPVGKITTRYQLGPVLIDGTILARAEAQRDTVGQWEVAFYTTAQASPAFDAMAAKEYHHQVAIVLGNVLVLSAPLVNATAFGGSGVIVGNLTAQEAKTIAQILSTPG